jgi:hypothetical protein
MADAIVRDSSTVTGFERLREIARKRLTGWRSLEAAVGDPKDESARAFLDGTLARDLAAAVSWLDRDRELFSAPLALLAGFAELHGPAVTAEFTGLLEEQLGPISDIRQDLVAEIGDLRELCAREATAWASGDLEGAKDLRMREHRFLTERIAPFVARLRARPRVDTGGTLLAALTDFFVAFVAVELGWPRNTTVDPRPPEM